MTSGGPGSGPEVTSLVQGASHPADWSAAVWASVVFLAIGGTALGFTWFADGVKQLGAAKASAFVNLVPVFAVGRTQEIIYMLADLVRRKRLSPLKIYVDSPMANSATHITLAHTDLLDQETRELLVWLEAHPDKVKIEFVADVERSKALNAIRSGAVIVSASGMCEAGRIRHHLLHNLHRRDSTVLFVGYQAQGSLGRVIMEGAERVRISGEDVRVRAQIRAIQSYSAHADQSELLDWITDRMPIAGSLFLDHGEGEAQETMRRELQRRHGRVLRGAGPAGVEVAHGARQSGVQAPAADDIT